MARPLGTAGRDAPRTHIRHVALPCTLALAAVLILLAGGASLLQHLADDAPRPYRAPAALLLIFCALVQLHVAWKCWQRRLWLRVRAMRVGRFCEWLLVGAVACYVVMLFLGPDPNLRYLYRALAAVWYTALLLPLERAAPMRLTPAEPSGGFWRWAGHSAFFAVLVALGAEGSLRLYAVIADRPLAAVAVAYRHTLPPGSIYRGAKVNALGFWGRDFQSQPRPGTFRVAVLGDECTLSGDSRSNCLMQLERQLPGVEVYNFGVAGAGPREYDALLASDVLGHRPQLVLAFISVGDDVTEPLPLPHWSDWRALVIFQLPRRGPQSEATLGAPPSAAADWESYLQRAAAGLAVCRCPIDEPTRAKWDAALAHLQTMSLRCAQREIALVLVVLPTEAQVDAELRRTLCRRCGLSPDQVDADLPQRRLAVFAQEHGIPVIDLLPHFRAAGHGLYLRHATDLSEQGHALTAEQLRRYLECRHGREIASAARLTQRVER